MNIAEAAASPYTGAVVWGCLIAGGVFLIAGLLVALFFDLPGAIAASKAAKLAADAADAAAKKKEEDGQVDAVAQGNVADLLTGAAALAAALKDLTVATRLAMIGVFLVAVAALAAGADAIGKSDGATAPATSTSTTK